MKCFAALEIALGLAKFTCCLMWAAAGVLHAESEEFIDLDGAVPGFFADGPDRPATFHAYHALPVQEGYWVSTGVSEAPTSRRDPSWR